MLVSVPRNNEIGVEHVECCSKKYVMEGGGGGLWESSRIRQVSPSFVTVAAAVTARNIQNSVIYIYFLEMVNFGEKYIIFVQFIYIDYSLS